MPGTSSVLSPSPSGSPPHPLAKRLAALRRRLRVVATVRGLSWLFAVLALILIAGGALDWWLHLPGVVRAIFLVGALAGGGIIACRYLIVPLSQRNDDLALALRVENEYPELNDCLASTIQFMQQPGEPDTAASASLRQAAMRQAMIEAGDCDFNRIIDSRGIRLAVLSVFVAAGLVIGLLLWQPAAAATALIRIGHPFGTTEWPPATLIELDPSLRTRIARGEPFELRAALRGVVPERAVVRFWFEGANPSDHTYTVKRSEDQPGKRVESQEQFGAFVARLEPIRVQKSFRFQVQANDNVTKWQTVSVLPPVALVPFNGKASPQVRLHLPTYTDLPSFDLPAGTSSIEGVAGTRVSMVAATDRPLSAAWIEYHPDQPTFKLTTLLTLLPARHVGEALTAAVVGQPVWGRFPITVESLGAGSALRTSFVPWVGGTYAMRLVDESNLVSSRLFDIRIFPDPPPLVTLERPSASHDSLAVLPGATITLRGVAEDPVFAVRSMWFEHRTSRDDPPRARLLWDHRSAGTVPLMLFPSVMPYPVAMPLPPIRLRPIRVEAERRIALSTIKHEDGRPLKEGDVVILQIVADDFDDVTSGKPAGRSHEIELRIISPPALEALLHHAQEQVQQELQRLREEERESVKKTAPVEKQWRTTGKLRPEDLDNLLQAEQLQQQIRGRIGTKEEGLRAEVERIRQTLRDNNVPRGGTQARMEQVGQELDRLAREELEQIEPLLTEARKQNELAQEKPPTPQRRQRGPLAEAGEHQQEVERTLSDLLASLDPFSTKRQARAEAKAIQAEQKKLGEQVNKLKEEIPQGKEAEQPDQKAELERAGEWQGRLAAEKLRQADEKEAGAQEKQHLQQMREAQAEEERAAGHTEKAQQLAEEARTLRREAEAMQDAAEAMRQEAHDLEKAAQAGRSRDAEGQMKQAGQNIKGNKLSNAGENQQKSADAMEQIAKALDERRAEDLDRLVKNLKDARKEMERLVEEQDKLQKKVKEAQKLEDPKEREEELQRLAREQEKVRQQAREMAQQLSRMRAGQAGQSLREAGAEMDQAAEMLGRGENPEEAEQEALERLKDAVEDLEDAQEQAQEELLREKLQKIAEQIKLLKDRQEAQLPETERINNELLQKKQWQRGLRISLNRQAESQKAIAEDTAALSKDKLKDAEVFTHIMEKARKAMDDAAKAMKERAEKAADLAEKPLNEKAEDTAYQHTLKAQKDAIAHLEALLDALKPDDGLRARGGAGSGSGGGGKSGPEGDGIPELAQLKLLKSLQLDVNKRTEELAKNCPDPAKMSPAQEQELAGLRQDQAEISRLLDGLTAPAKPEGDKP
jgi:hypothetical protein